MAPNAYDQWGKWTKSHGKWYWVEAATPKADEKPKNWRCPTCGYTGNAAHWTWCGGPKCTGEWKPEAPALQSWDWAYDAAKSPVDHELDDARAHLSALAATLPTGHTTIDEYSKKVIELEARKVAEVPTTERLRLLLADTSRLLKRKETADAATSAAVVAVQKATAFLQSKTKDSETATADYNGNTLEIAELTRPGRPGLAAETPVAAPVTAFRTAIDEVDAGQLAKFGMTQERLGDFFAMFAQLTSALEAAKAAPLHAPAPVAEAPPAVEVAPVLPRILLQLNTPAESVRELAAPVVAAEVITASVPAEQATQRGKRRERDGPTDSAGDNVMNKVNDDDSTDEEDPDAEVAQLPKRALKAAADAVTDALKGKETTAPADKVAASSGSSG